MTLPYSPAEIEACRQRAEKATPGPWRKKHASGWNVERENGGSTFVGIGEVTGNEVIALAVASYPGDDDLLSDAAFIAHARADIPALLATIDALQATIAESGEKLRSSALANLDLISRGDNLRAQLASAERIRDDAVDARRIATDMINEAIQEAERQALERAAEWHDARAEAGLRHLRAFHTGSAQAIRAMIKE